MSDASTKAGDYTACKTVADVEAVLARLPSRQQDFAAAMSQVGVDPTALFDNPRLAAEAERLNRMGEVARALNNLKERA